MALPVAVQVYSVRDSAEANLADTLRKIKAMGYDGVEFAGLYGYAPEYIKGLIDALELIPVSAHIPLDEMLADPDKTFAAYQTIGVKFAAVPYVTPERRPGAEKFFETIDEIAKLGEIAKKYGITLLYHIRRLWKHRNHHRSQRHTNLCSSLHTAETSPRLWRM